MKPIHTVAALMAALVITSCGRSESDLRSELQDIDHEMMRLRMEAGGHQATMNRAEADAFLGSFAAGYGAVSGDVGLAADGAGAVINSNHAYESSGRRLEQLDHRYQQLEHRRGEILSDLK